MSTGSLFMETDMTGCEHAEQAGRRLSPRILTYTGLGVVIPHTLEDVRAALVETGHTVLVQDIVATGRTCSAAVKIAIVDGLVAASPDIVFTVDRVGLIPGAIAVLQRPKKVISWIYDNPGEFLSRDFGHIASRFEVFTWDRAYIPMLNEKGFPNVRYMPFATNPAVNKPAGDGQYLYDVSFVGGWSYRRMRILQSIAAAGVAVDVFGDERWKEAESPLIRYHGPASNRVDCPEIYSRSRINLNITSEQLITSIPVRVFDVLACGGFLLSDFRPDMADLFEMGKELAVVKEDSRMADAVRYYLDSPAERDRFRAAGRVKVLDRYTFNEVLPGMIESAMKSEHGIAAQNQPMPVQAMVEALWMTGLSYMKFGEKREAMRRLTDALSLAGKNEDIMLALAVLSRDAGISDGMKTCMDALSAWGSPNAGLRDKVAAGGTMWHDLYRKLAPDIVFNPDGTVPGWEPKSCINGMAGEDEAGK